MNITIHNISSSITIYLFPYYSIIIILSSASYQHSSIIISMASLKPKWSILQCSCRKCYMYFHWCWTNKAPLVQAIITIIIITIITVIHFLQIININMIVEVLLIITTSVASFFIIVQALLAWMEYLWVFPLIMIWR